jgi:RES domain-containing protein
VAEHGHPADLPLARIEAKTFWRCLPRQYLHTALEAGPSFTRDRRYSIRGEFGALYFSGSRDLCLKEATGRAGQDAEPLAMIEFEITASRLVNLTQAQVRKELHVRLDDLLRPRISKDAYLIPQAIARKVYGWRLHGLMAPSVYDPISRNKGWFNLILFPANLIRSAIREVSIQDAALPVY